MTKMPKLPKLPKLPKIKDVNHFIEKNCNFRIPQS